MADPLLAEVLNPRLALQRRLAGEGEGNGYIPDTPAGQGKIPFTKPFTPEERARQAQMLAKILMMRQHQPSAPPPLLP